MRVWLIPMFLLALRLGGAEVTVAAAGDLRGSLEAVARAFEARNPAHRLRLVYGASGTLTTQIRQGAPFDAFLSADLGFPEALVASGHAEGPVVPYAMGTLVLWVRADLGLDPSAGLKVLQAPAIRHIATAHAGLAPYGRAAEAALRAAGLLEALAPRRVMAENVAQAAQFVRTGAAEAGLLSLSQAQSLPGGRTWIVPAGFHPPLRQGAVLLRRSQVPEAVRTFLAFLKGPEGQGILARFGYQAP